MRKIDGMAQADAPAFDTDMAQEMLLQAANPLAARKADRAQMIMLAGAMQPYVWAIDGQTWDTHIPITAVSGERAELMFHNMSMMGHMMHLHGHVFLVVNIQRSYGQRGAARHHIRAANGDGDSGAGCRRGGALDAALPPHAASFRRHDDRICRQRLNLFYWGVCKAAPTPFSEHG